MLFSGGDHSAKQQSSVMRLTLPVHTVIIYEAVPTAAFLPFRRGIVLNVFSIS